MDAPARSYRVLLTGESRVALGDTPQRLRFQLDAILRLETGGGACLERPRLTLTQNGRAQSDACRVLQQELSLPFSIRREPDGAVVGLAFSPGLSPGARQLLRSLVSFWQTTRPLSACRESDLTGVAEVRYLPLGARLYEKRVVRYLPDPDSLTRQTPDGVQRIRFAADGGVQSIQGVRGVTTRLGGREIARSTLAGSVQAVPYHPRPRSAPPPRLGAFEPLFQPLDTPEQQRQRRANTLGRDTPGSLLRTLEALPGDAGQQEANRIFLKLRALFTLRPDAAPTFAPYLAHTDSATPGFRALVDALQQAGGEQAQRLLLDTASRRSADSGLLSVVLPALAAARPPLAETETLLRALSRRDDDAGRGATLLLGTLAHTLQGTSRAAALIDELMRRLSAAESEAGQTLLLSALGNTGAPSLPATVAPFLGASSPDLRGAALSALRLVAGADAEGRLLAALRTDPDPRVRECAAFALTFLPRSEAVRRELDRRSK